MFATLKDKIFGGNNVSGSKAKSRLHFVLVQDRAGLSADEMKSFKRELMETIERYFEVNVDEFDIEYKRDPDSTMLLINSPVRVKRKGRAEEKKAEKKAGKKAVGAEGSEELDIDDDSEEEGQAAADTEAQPSA